MNQFWLVLLIGLIFYWLERRFIARCFFWGTLFYFFLISSTPLPIYLTLHRESRYPVLYTIPDTLKNVNILVLGGGHSIAPTLPATDQLSSVALARLSEGIRLVKSSPVSACLIGSGYSSTGRVSQGEMLMHAAIALDVPASDTLWVSTPHNTETEALAYAARFTSDTPLILVTSAIHLPRAMYWFEQAGLSPIAAPADHLVKTDPERSPYTFKPSTAKIDMWGKLLHEWVGMWYAKYKTI